MAAKIIAIAGASGYVGKAFTSALLDAPAFDVRILTRESSLESAPLQDFKKRGASLHAISYEDEASIVKALQGVDVLVATVAGNALVSAQIPLIKAAKSAGVKLFVPSEYGGAFENDEHPSPVIQGKKTVLKAAKEAGLPVAVVSNGGFPEYCFIPPLGYAFADKKVTVWGDGNHKVTWTTVRSVADWVANVLKTVPLEQLKDKHLNIQGDSASPNEIVKLWEQKHNDKLTVDYRPFKELEDRIKADKNDFLAAILDEWHSGRGELKPLSNDLYPGWKPETVESVL
ncbi:NmrA-like family domain-containing protein 1 [Ceratobasidium sp. AG-Ba]|nr:NmrA-like family domain-containing protein 1 [Ceratobasidium sp. AG-Ba]QRW02150.1 NmrA-like family domain-containing protein 1 [Ceratobasidium sp. AG-Ba]